ncbi:hypothetical protein [Dietzia sp. 179-F 9C3 NHS]|uniref:hypothetical protein n=1 Tax=Dietzia sp. 179-F 9C3 NHS TaxID=3374295 RepID=UPI00387950A4
MNTDQNENDRSISDTHVEDVHQAAMRLHEVERVVRRAAYAQGGRSMVRAEFALRIAHQAAMDALAEMRRALEDQTGQS